MIDPINLTLTYRWKVQYYTLAGENDTVAGGLNYQQAYRLKKRLEKKPFTGKVYVLLKEPYVEVK